jgi:transposase
MRCAVTGCKVQTFREQVPGVLDRYQRRTTRLTGQVSAVARESAGRASARLLPALGIAVSRHAMLRVLLKIPLPALAVPRVLGIDDFALRRGLVYATVLIDAGTGRRIDVVPGRTADVAEKWLRDYPGVEVVCRDGSGAYGEAVRQALPGAVQVSDRWHLWHGLGEAVRKEVAAHSACWAKGTPLQEGKRAATTLERWQQVHDLRARNAGLLECARRLNLSLNTVKRYDRASEPERLQRVPKYRPALVDPYRDHLRNAGPRSRGSRSGSSCGRSGNSATRAALTCSSATSTRAAQKATGRTCHPAGPPGSCSPGRTASPPASTRRSPGSPQPAPR